MAAEFLFPAKQTRRDFLWAAGTAAVAGLSAGASRADAPAKPVTIGAGKHTYTLDETWGHLPAGMKYGYGCAIVVDSQDRVIITSRETNPCVAVFDKAGKLLETWAKQFADNVGLTTEQVKATAHGLYLSKEPDGEFLYWTENKAAGKDGQRLGARVYKTDMAGKVLYTIGNVAAEDATHQKFDWVSPTDVAVAPNGDIYVVDGYGSQKLSRFDKAFKHLKTIGKKGTAHGEFSTNHGVWVSTLRKEPELYVADRANDRIEVYSLELDYKRTIPGVRKPCCFYQHGGLMYVPELDARVTILDADDKVVAHLGDGKGVKDNQTRPDVFATPHALTVASNGDLYVVEWLPFGRPRKFKKTPA